MLQKPTRQELFSWAFLMAVAAKAGCNVSRPMFDTDSIDWSLSLVIEGEFNSRPQIDVQIKCTQNLSEEEDYYKFPLQIKNYNELRITNTYNLRILLVVAIPKEEDLWLYQTVDELTLRKCGYWTTIKGYPRSENSTTVTVNIPKANIFDQDAVMMMFRKISTGADL